MQGHSSRQTGGRQHLQAWEGAGGKGTGKSSSRELLVRAPWRLLGMAWGHELMVQQEKAWHSSLEMSERVGLGMQGREGTEQTEQDFL